MTDEKNNKFIQQLSLLCVLVAFAYLFCITFIPLSPTGKDFANTALGFLLGTVISGVLAFWIGSSNGSQKKDATIAAQAQSQAPGQVAVSAIKPVQTQVTLSQPKGDTQP